MLIQYSGTQQGAVMKKIEELEAQVAKNTSAEQSAVELLNGLSAMLKDAGTDPAKLSNLIASLDMSGSALAAAVIANTPVAA